MDAAHPVYPKGKGIDVVPSSAPCFGYSDPIMLETFQSNYVDQEIDAKQSIKNPPFEFEFHPEANSFIHLSSIYMTVKAKIKLADGKNLEAADNHNVGAINNFINSVWRQIDVKLNERIINEGSSTHIGYKSMLETVLSYSSSTANKLEAAGFFAPKTKSCDKPYTKSKQWFAQSTTVDFTGTPCIDFLRSDNHLAPGNKLSLIFHPTSDDFIIHTSSTKKYKLEIVDVKMYCRRIFVEERHLPKVIHPTNPKKYETTHLELLTFTIPEKLRLWSTKLFTNREKPKHLVIAQIKQSSFVGNIKTDPYVFEHNNLNHLNFKIGNKCITGVPLKPDFKGGLYAREYLRLFMEAGKTRMTQSMLINLDQFETSQCLFPFDLTPDNCNGAHQHVIDKEDQKEIWELEIGYQTPLPSTMTILVMASFDNVITIDPKTKEVKSYLY